MDTTPPTSTTPTTYLSRNSDLVPTKKPASKPKKPQKPDNRFAVHSMLPGHTAALRTMEDDAARSAYIDTLVAARRARRDAAEADQ